MMEKQISKIWYFIAILFLYALYNIESSRMFIVEDETSLSILFPLIMSVVSVASMFLLKANQDKQFKPFLILIVVTYLISLIHSLYFPYPARSCYITLILPAFTAIFAYRLIDNGINQAFLFSCLCVLFAMLALFFFSNYSNNALLDISSQNNAAYTLLYFLPLLLCVKNKYVRIAAIIVTSIALLFSLKRGGTLAFALALVAYLFVELHVLSQKTSKLSYLILIVICIWGAYEVYSNFFSGQADMLINRFSLGNEGGSGRDGIYRAVLNLISSSDIIGYLLGHGYGGVLNTSIGLSAHNDYLEFMYDYGILGLCLLIVFVYKFARYTIYLCRCKSFYAGPATFALIIILVNTLVSHIFYYEWYMLIWAIFFGLIYALPKVDNPIKR